MSEHTLSLRPIGENDYGVVREDRAIGRVRLADERAVTKCGSGPSGRRCPCRPGA
jgi:hypothetical protein